VGTRRVKVETVGADWVELSGLSAGERVVTR
jgi:hypothetical protein